jgi:acyl-CoA dehydrogenase
MLMECLAVGRGVSLPASSNGASKAITFGISNYIKHRRQFNMAIGNMEAVREKYVDMFYHTWIINSSVQFMNHILDQGSVPSVLTAIMKQQTTERSRIVLNHGMDIYAGSGICIGENNFLTKYYNASPVGITVEGSNTLTRGLIIFGQGLNKSHPHIYNIFNSIQDNNIDDFNKNFDKMLKDVIINYGKSIKADGMICGHIHHANIRDIDGLQYMNCGDWVESCTALVEHLDGKWEIVKWNKQDSAS